MRPACLRGILRKNKGRAVGKGTQPRPDLLPSSCLPQGPEARDLALTPLSGLFFPLTGSLLLSSLSERVRGCRPGHKGGLGRNL